jgi:hypothetical protein
MSSSRLCLRTATVVRRPLRSFVRTSSSNQAHYGGAAVETRRRGACADRPDRLIERPRSSCAGDIGPIRLAGMARIRHNAYVLDSLSCRRRRWRAGSLRASIGDDIRRRAWRRSRLKPAMSRLPKRRVLGWISRPPLSMRYMRTRRRSLVGLPTERLLARVPVSRVSTRGVTEAVSHRSAAALRPLPAERSE